MKRGWIATGCLFVFGGMLPLLALAQKDTISSSGVTIVSSFRPTLKETPKINFSAAALAADTTRSVLPYRVPDRQLMLDYSVRSVQPLAYVTDTARPFTNRSFVKAGYGNLRNPYVRVGVDRGDGVNKGLTAGGQYLSMTQRPDASDMRFYSLGEIKADGYTRIKGSPFKLLSAIGFKREIIRNNLAYDSARAITSFADDSVRQQFSLLSAQVQLRSISANASGISIAPLIGFYQFFDARKNSERQLQLQAPLQKQLGESWLIQTLFSLQSLRYQHQRGSRLSVGATDTLLQSTLFAITPSVRYQQSSFQVQAAVSPTWNRGDFAVLPQLSMSYVLPEKKIVLLAGWNGKWNQNTYRELAALHPWIWAPESLWTTRLTERYLGVKGEVNPRLSYDIRTQYITANDQLLFINDTAHAPRSVFKVVRVDQLSQLQLDARIAYKVAEQFSFSSQLVVNHFFKLQGQPVAWGLLPLEWQNSLRVAITDELWLQSDLVLFRGAPSIDTYKNNARAKGAADLNAGLSFRLSRSLQLWAQFDNLFNQPYQRWNQNPVFGFNCSGGIVFSLDEKKKP
jgi:hypothetical protein